MNFIHNMSDKNVIAIILITILFVFGLIFTVKSPERKVIDSPILWKNEYTDGTTSDFNNFDNLI